MPLLCIYSAPHMCLLCFYHVIVSPGISTHQHHDGAKVGSSQQHFQVFWHLKQDKAQTVKLRQDQFNVQV